MGDGLPASCQFVIQKDKQNGTFQAEMEMTTGLDMLPMLGENLEKVMFNTGLEAHRIGSIGGNDMLYILKSEIRKREALHSRNKVVLGLQVSKMSEGLFPDKGPWSYGTKIENRIKLDEALKASLGLGLCQSCTPGVQKQ